MTAGSTTSPGSLYAVLAEEAPNSSPDGETISTKAKETVDRDVEAFALEELMQHGR